MDKIYRACAYARNAACNAHEPKPAVARKNLAGAQKSFEVGEDVYNQFLAQNEHNQKYFKASIRENHYLLDLSGYIEGKLNNLGISNKTVCKEDTYTNEEQYYSYRRDTHQGKIEFPSDFPVELSTIRL